MRNRLLQALPIEILNAIRPQLEDVPLAVGDMIAVANEPITQAYFLESGLASITLNIADRGCLEAWVAGRDGMVSTALVLGVEHTPFDAEIRLPGHALRISADALRRIMTECDIVREVLMRYVQVVTLWTSQMALANRRHKTQERLSLCLLLANDRLDGRELMLTHEMLSVMLGTHRPGVTVALRDLERARLITTRRGQITILDRDRLIDAAGGTYGIAEAEYERLIGSFGEKTSIPEGLNPLPPPQL